MRMSGNTIFITGGTSGIGLGMPRPALLTEVMDILRTEPGVREICVSDALFMHSAEAQGRHDDVLAMFSGAH